MDNLITITGIRKDGNKTFVTYRKVVQVGDHAVLQRMPEIELSGSLSKEEAVLKINKETYCA